MKTIAVAEKVGIYSNSKQDGIYPLYQIDAEICSLMLQTVRPKHLQLQEGHKGSQAGDK
jgi:hypothetical protein